MNTEIDIKPSLKLSTQTQNILCCPICNSSLQWSSEHLNCTNSQCRTSFPVVNKIPILINEDKSVFAIADYTDTDNLLLKPKSKLERLLIDLVPSITLNLSSQKNFQKFVALLQKQNQKPRVLVVGASIEGQGIEPLLSAKDLELVEVDVAFGDRVGAICDLHNLPFADESFDGVVVQAVLEHVADPFRCVEEIYRVLKPNALVYAETPFIAQVHLGKYDFTRFTHLGHRRLFRKFDEVESGVACGPGVALAWSYQYFLLSFVNSKIARALVKVFARITSFWLIYFDYFLANKPGSYDAALGYYFIGTKSEKVLSDRELLKLYRGTQYSSF
ncbi:MAG: methyltransferase domain-containing protein [Xenococcaceae cyanobacterium]